MTTMTRTQADEVWAAIDDQRTRTADMLEHLTDEQWQHPSLCDGWTVRHVATHLTLQQQRLRDITTMVAGHPSLLRGVTLNRTIHDTAVLQAQHVTNDEIIARIRQGVGTRRHITFVTPLETLTDFLVHSQDIAIPLGVDLAMLPSACAIAATRRWDTRHGWMSLSFRRLPLDDCRLTATDTDWTRGHGAAVDGPIAALLLLITGRTVALAQLTGAGADALRANGTSSP